LAFGGVVGECGGALVGRRGVLGTAEPEEQVAAYRVQNIVVVQAVEGVYERQGGGRAVHLGYCDRAVQCDDRGGYHGGQVVLWRENLLPVGVGGGIVVHSVDGGL